MSERVWNKFHPVFGPDLKVGFETTFPRGAVLDLDPLYEKNELIHKSLNEPLIRVYEPARVMGSCCDGRMANVLFVPVPQKGALFRRLVFARKIDRVTRQARRWMIVARHGEITTFGFDSWNSKNQRYLALAYPGEGGEFVPTYMKIKDVNGGFVYLELGAYDDEVQVLFTAIRVEERKVPKLLKNLEV